VDFSLHSLKPSLLPKIKLCNMKLSVLPLAPCASDPMCNLSLDVTESMGSSSSEMSAYIIRGKKCEHWSHLEAHYLSIVNVLILFEINLFYFQTQDEGVY
jgi:hypothetical protein